MPYLSAISPGRLSTYFMMWSQIGGEGDRMSVSFRLLAAVGVLVLAVAGCQQGKEKAEKAKTKSGDAATRGASASSAGGGAGKAAADSRTGGSALTLRAADDGKVLNLRQGQVVTVVLDSNRSAGFSWVMGDPTGTSLTRDSGPIYVQKSGKGSGGTETWRFRAVRPGRQTVRLEYGRPWTRNVPERTFRFTATVR